MSSLIENDSADLEALSEEKQPLLVDDDGVGSRRTSYTFNSAQGDVACKGLTPREKQDLADHGILDSMRYGTQNLTSWSCFTINCRTVWLKPALWIMMLRLSLVALVTCVLTVLLVPNPAVYKVAKFTSVSKFLNVVVGLLLGFFLSSSMNRWHQCVDGFLGLCDAVRNMQIQFLALGVPEEDIVRVLRYGSASAWLLYAQLVVECKKLTQAKEAEEERESMWIKLSQKKARIDRTGKSFLLSEKEIDVLRVTHDPPYIVWTWVGVILGRLAQDGWIPPMPSPTYGRVMNLCQEDYQGIDHGFGSRVTACPRLDGCHPSTAGWVERIGSFLGL